MTPQKLTPQKLLGPLNEVEAKNAPQELFVCGDTGLLTRGTRVSIVGSRRASPEGLQRAKKLAVMLVERGVVVVSGLAEGIDALRPNQRVFHSAGLGCLFVNGSSVVRLRRTSNPFQIV